MSKEKETKQEKKVVFVKNNMIDLISIAKKIKEKETKQETSLGMIDEFEFTNIIRMNSNLGANPTQDRIKEALKSQLQTYFKNEKLGLEKGCGKEENNEIVFNKKNFLELIMDNFTGELNSFDEIQKALIEFENIAKLTQLNKTEKDILGEIK